MEIKFWIKVKYLCNESAPSAEWDVSPSIERTQPTEGRQQKQEELQFCSLWKENHIHRKTDKMKRQRTLYQMEEQYKSRKKQLIEVEIGNLPGKEFRIMTVKMIQDLGKRMEAKIEKTQEMFNKDLEELKNKHLEELKKKQR